VGWIWTTFLDESKKKGKGTDEEEIGEKNLG